MRCVKLTLPPRARRRWLLMTMRLSIISFAGIVRTLVAVGIESDASMFVARDFAIPRSGTTVSSVGAIARRPCTGASAGMGWAFGPAGVGFALAAARGVVGGPGPGAPGGRGAVAGGGGRAAPRAPPRPPR